VVGCRAEDRIVCLSINVANSQPSGNAVPRGASSENNLNVYLNGNLFRSVKSGFVVAPVDKYLKAGCNAIEIGGTAIAPVEIRLAAYESDHRTINRVILDEKVTPIAYLVKWNQLFQLKKTVRLPIFEEKNQLPNHMRAEQEIGAIVTNMYQTCVSSNWDEFCRITLEGYKKHSPAEYLDVTSGVRSMIRTFRPKAFPERLRFVFGKNLVYVYSCVVAGNKVLFESDEPDSCAVGAVEFAYIDGRWIVW